MKNVLDFKAMKQNGEKITATTCYDFWSARILDESSIDMVLVGDSAAAVYHGFADTLRATPEMMEMHTAAVRRGTSDKFLVGDMPFLSYRKGLVPAMDCVQRFMTAGANAVKFEGVRGHEDIIGHTVESGIPVMGHVGLIPQSLNALGGLKVQAREKHEIDALVDDAKRLEELGCFSIVLECVSSAAGRAVTDAIGIPTIGIGAGPHCDGQVLVLHDLVGFNRSFKAKFARPFADGFQVVRDAVDAYAEAVRKESFPTERESYK